MDGIDIRKRKPRRTAGTPAYHHRNRFALAVIAAGSLLFAALAFTPIFQNYNNYLKETFLQPSEDELARRTLLRFPAARSSKAILETLESKKDMESK